MLQICKSNICGKVDYGWLNFMYIFFFVNYYDLCYVSFGFLCVINEDCVQGGQGFGIYSYSNMEIIFYVFGGVLEYKDLMGIGLVLCYGDVQWMSVGSGVSYSEFNYLVDEVVYFLQIWLFFDQENIVLSYQEIYFVLDIKCGQFCLIVLCDGCDGLLLIYQDVNIYVIILDGDDCVYLLLVLCCGVYVQVVCGQFQVNGIILEVGDVLQISDEVQVMLENGNDVEVIVFELLL